MTAPTITPAATVHTTLHDEWLHDAYLVDTVALPAGATFCLPGDGATWSESEALNCYVVEHRGATYHLPMLGPVHGTRPERKIGVLQRVTDQHFNQRYRFRPYYDQALRRAPALDVLEEGMLGWVIGGHHFRAPNHIVPGASGQYLPDQTARLTLNIPPELERLASAYDLEVEALLRSFIGDLCDIGGDTFALPRADRYQRNGEAESSAAETWLDRAHGHQWRGEQGVVAEARDDLFEEMRCSVLAYAISGGSGTALIDLVLDTFCLPNANEQADAQPLASGASHNTPDAHPQP